MNRRDLFKRAGLLAAGAVAAPLAGKATPEPEVTWSEPITGEAVDFGSDLIVDGKKIGTVHSVEFSQPFMPPSAPTTRGSLFTERTQMRYNDMINDGLEYVELEFRVTHRGTGEPPQS